MAIMILYLLLHYQEKSADHSQTLADFIGNKGVDEWRILKSPDPIKKIIWRSSCDFGIQKCQSGPSGGSQTAVPRTPRSPRGIV